MGISRGCGGVTVGFSFGLFFFSVPRVWEDLACIMLGMGWIPIYLMGMLPLALWHGTSVLFFYRVGLYSIMLHGRVLEAGWTVVNEMGCSTTYGTGMGLTQHNLAAGWLGIGALSALLVRLSSTRYLVRW